MGALYPYNSEYLHIGEHPTKTPIEDIDRPTKTTNNLMIDKILHIKLRETFFFIFVTAIILFVMRS